MIEFELITHCFFYAMESLVSQLLAVPEFFIFIASFSFACFKFLILIKFWLLFSSDVYKQVIYTVGRDPQSRKPIVAETTPLVTAPLIVWAIPLRCLTLFSLSSPIDYLFKFNRSPTHPYTIPLNFCSNFPDLNHLFCFYFVGLSSQLFYPSSQGYSLLMQV